MSMLSVLLIGLWSSDLRGILAGDRRLHFPHWRRVRCSHQEQMDVACGDDIGAVNSVNMRVRVFNDRKRFTVPRFQNEPQEKKPDRAGCFAT